jgi:hypothetical protein
MRNAQALWDRSIPSHIAPKQTLESNPETHQRHSEHQEREAASEDSLDSADKSVWLDLPAHWHRTMPTCGCAARPPPLLWTIPNIASFMSHRRGCAGLCLVSDQGDRLILPFFWPSVLHMYLCITAFKNKSGRCTACKDPREVPTIN